MRFLKAAMSLLGSAACFFALFSRMPPPFAFMIFAGGVSFGTAAVCQGSIAVFRLDNLKGRGVANAIIGLGIVTAVVIVAVVGWQLFVGEGDNGHGPG